uniref:SCAN box domain-containing protein n=1 Tax=Scleropages formosus TaxID=113540 RepID=A0A8C9SRV9_SCLFO
TCSLWNASVAVVPKSGTSLPSVVAGGYGTVWEAVMERVGLMPEGHSQRLRGLRRGESAWPFLFSQRVLDSAWRWLQPDRQDLERIVEQVTLEQFVATMPASTTNWLQCHWLETLTDTIRLAENRLAMTDEALSPPSITARPCGSRPLQSQLTARVRPSLAPGHPVPAPTRPSAPVALPSLICPHLSQRVPLASFFFFPRGGPSGGRNAGTGVLVALLDSACQQMMVHQSLAPPGAWHTRYTVKVRCVHGDDVLGVGLTTVAL